MPVIRSGNSEDIGADIMHVSGSRSVQVQLAPKNTVPVFQSFLPSIRLQLRVCEALITLPFEWDSVKGNVRLLKSQSRKEICRFQAILHTVYVLLMVANFARPDVQAYMTHSQRMLSLSFLVCFTTTMIERIVIWRKKTEIVLLLNNYVLFERRYMPAIKPDMRADVVSRWLTNLGFMTSVGLPSLMCTMLLVETCKPPELGFILFAREGGCAVPGWKVRGAIMVFEGWIWANAITTGVFFAFQVFYPGLRFFSFYIQLVLNLYHDKLPAAQARVQSRIRTSVRDNYCFQVYHHIQLLARLYNFCLQSALIPTQIMAACCVIIIGLYTCIKLNDVVPMPGFAFFPLLAADGFAMIFISQFGAGVLTRSESFVGRTRRSVNYKRSSYFRKLARSTALIKIRFGSTNFIDKMTPLIYINFCLTQTVSLVLLS